jgi:hypothetical protein
MTQTRKLAPTIYIPTGLNSLDGWPTLPVATQPVSKASLFSRVARTISLFLSDTAAHDGVVPHRSAA